MSDPSSSLSFDVLVIGAGPGGYVAALRGAQLGLKVGLIEAQELGGVCLNWGCIPTKALLRSAEIFDLVRRAQDFGVTVSDIGYDFSKIIERSRHIAHQLTQGIQHLLKKNKVTVIKGRARFLDKKKGMHCLQVGSLSLEEKGPERLSGSEIYQAPHVILATGARARTLPGVEPDGQMIWTYREAMVPQKRPDSLLIVGSGAIGIEFASFYQALGTSITVVEMRERILPSEDEEISTLAQKAFEKKGIVFLTGTQVIGVKKESGGVRLSLKTPQGVQEKEVQKVLLAMGITGNSDGINLESTRVKVEKGQVVTDAWCETDEPGIYAIGDVAGPPWLAHKASHEGVLAMEKIGGQGSLHSLKGENIPGCTYSNPQIASVGLTENQARDQGYRIKVGRFPFLGNGKALALGEGEGLIKTIFDDKTGELLGAHLIGSEVTELIQGFVIAKTAELTEAELHATIFPHPTLSEMMYESVLSADQRALHI